MTAALILESGWQWWLVAALALVYGLGLIVTVIMMLIKSGIRR